MQSHYKKNAEKRRKDHYEGKKRKLERESHIKRKAKVARTQANITGYQKIAMELLDKARINYVYEKPIQHFKTFFLIDIYLPETKICIEID